MDFKTLIQALLPKENKGESLKEIDTKKENISPSTAPPRPYGLKKSAIFAVLGIVAVIFLTSMAFGLFSGGSKKTTGEPAPPPVVTNPISPAAGHPSTYEEMAKQFSAQKGPQQQKPPAQPPPQQPQQQLQQQLQQQQYVPPQITPLPSYAVQQQQAPNPAQARSDDEYKKSPIGVRLENKDSKAVTKEASKSTDISAENMEDTQQQGVQNTHPKESQQKSGDYTLNVKYQSSGKYQLNAGTIIPAVLITGINSDLKAQVVAQVRQNVYDSLTGGYLLIPQGTRLLGSYGGEKVGAGQNRLGVTWERMTFPNGHSIDLGSMASLDEYGYPGMKDQVNNHETTLYRAAFWSSLLAAGATSATGGSSGTENRSPGQEAVAGAAANILNMAGKIMDKQLNISPTITIRPGMVFDVFVGKDILGLRPYR